MNDKAYPPPLLDWKPADAYGTKEAWLGTPDDGVRFTISTHPTCYRRGPHRLLIEVCGGPNHHKWGCFDDADQPMRNYHQMLCAESEAECIARVLRKDRDQAP
jgi:hypothetical protein